MVVARREQALQELSAKLSELGAQQVVPVVGDITATKTRTAIFEKIESSWGQLDLLVNNAGVIRDNLLALLSELDLPPGLVQQGDVIQCQNRNGESHGNAYFAGRSQSKSW